MILFSKPTNVLFWLTDESTDEYNSYEFKLTYSSVPMNIDVEPTNISDYIRR
jgi:hypothetical protein